MPEPDTRQADVMTLSALLKSLGLTNRKSGRGYEHDILDGDRVIFTGDAHAVWAWLRATGRVA